jgi:hypothetical protein
METQCFPPPPPPRGLGTEFLDIIWMNFLLQRLQKGCFRWCLKHRNAFPLTSIGPRFKWNLIRCTVSLQMCDWACVITVRKLVFSERRKRTLMSHYCNVSALRTWTFFSFLWDCHQKHGSTDICRWQLSKEFYIKNHNGETKCITG